MKVATKSTLLHRIDFAIYAITSPEKMVYLNFNYAREKLFNSADVTSFNEGNVVYPLQ